MSMSDATSANEIGTAIAARALRNERPYAMAIAYRLLGSASDAEDVVQEALLRASEQQDLRSLRAFVTTVVTRLCLDELRSARRRRESYDGPWFPEPVVTTELDAPTRDDVVHKENVSLALLVVLEELSPLERAVFVLREVFELEFNEIGSAIGRSEQACRKLLSRARARIDAREQQVPANAGQQLATAGAFYLALASGDVELVMRVLAPDVVAMTDHGGKASAARKPVHGAERVARFLLGLSSKAAQPMYRVTSVPALLNGAPGVVVRRADGTLEAAAILRIEERAEGPRIVAFSFVRNPDKLIAAARGLVVKGRAGL